MSQTPHILLIGNGSEQVRLVTAGLAHVKEPHHLTRATTGEKALELLEDRERFSRRNPDLILLDTHLPGLDGFEMLRLLKSSALYRTIPVVMLAGPLGEPEVRKAYDFHANAVVRKGETLEQSVEIMESICRLWLAVAARPAGS